MIQAEKMLDEAAPRPGERPIVASQPRTSKKMPCGFGRALAASDHWAPTSLSICWLSCAATLSTSSSGTSPYKSIRVMAAAPAAKALCFNKAVPFCFYAYNTMSNAGSATDSLKIQDGSQNGTLETSQYSSDI